MRSTHPSSSTLGTTAPFSTEAVTLPVKLLEDHWMVLVKSWQRRDMAVDTAQWMLKVGGDSPRAPVFETPMLAWLPLQYVNELISTEPKIEHLCISVLSSNRSVLVWKEERRSTASKCRRTKVLLCQPQTNQEVETCLSCRYLEILNWNWLVSSQAQSTYGESGS